jgi:hypothetical protein
MGFEEVSRIAYRDEKWDLQIRDTLHHLMLSVVYILL